MKYNKTNRVEKSPTCVLVISIDNIPCKVSKMGSHTTPTIHCKENGEAWRFLIKNPQLAGSFSSCPELGSIEGVRRHGHPLADSN